MDIRRDRSRRRLTVAACIVLFVGPWLAAVGPATAPAGPFGGEPTLPAADRQQAATALATLARQLALTPGADGGVNAHRLLDLAQRLDPPNVRAASTARVIDRLHPPRSGRLPSDRVTVDAIGHVRDVAAAAERLATPPDQRVAAYLYAAASLSAAGGSPADDDRVRALAAAGAVADWDRVRAPGPTGTAAAALSSPTAAASTRPTVASIHGLVVSRAVDGRMHGRATEIIAVPAARTGRTVRIVGTVGREMQVSMDEAVRLARLRGVDLAGRGIEVSFDDKYSGKDGGSAGTAFTLLLLAYGGQLDLNPSAAVTGDVTVDGKVRPVGEVAAKVHGAALDHCRLVAIPAANADQMDDAVVLRGPSALWETQVFACQTVDDAIAVMRRDADPKLVEATKLFDALRAWYATAPAAALNAPAAQADLARVLALAPNHLSAAKLRQWAAGRAPTRLSLEATVAEAVAAAAPFQSDMHAMATFYTMSPPPPDAAGVAAARQSLRRLDKVGDPAGRLVAAAVDRFLTAYVDCVTVERAKGSAHEGWKSAVDRAKDADDEVQTEVRRLVRDPDVLDRLLHNG